jgi:hypothetical protein
MRSSCSAIVIALAIGAVGCSDANDFVGTWAYQPGSVVKTECTNSTMATYTNLTGTETISAGATSDLVWIYGGCVMKLNVDPADSAQSDTSYCTMTTPLGDKAEVEAAITFGIPNDDFTSMFGTGYFHVSSPTTTDTCELTYNAVLTKVSD